LKLISNQKESP